jgi:hypothetical protein
MKGKRTIFILVAILTIALPISVFAATSDTSAGKVIRGFFGIDTTKLTDKQKSDVKDYSKKMADLQKEFINKMVENGSITKAQGDAASKRIDEAIANGDFSMGMMRIGPGKGGMRRGFGFKGIDTSKLTDKQKAELAEADKKIADYKKELIGKEIASGLITKTQGDAMLKRIDDRQKNGSKSFGMGRGGFGGLMLFGGDNSKLTDNQKADITDYCNKVLSVKKEVITKLVSYGVMTKEEGASAIQRIDDMIKNGIPSDMGMGRRGFHRGSMNFNEAGNSASSM